MLQNACGGQRQAVGAVSLFHEEQKDQTQAIRLDSKLLDLLSHLFHGLSYDQCYYYY